MEEIRKSSDENEGENNEQQEEKTYEIEKILQKQKYPDGSVWYFIKWLGFGDADNTWEPEENIKHCTDVLAEFAEQQRRLKERKHKKHKNNEKVKSLSTLKMSKNELVESRNIDKDKQSDSIEENDEAANGVMTNSNRKYKPDITIELPPPKSKKDIKKSSSEKDQTKSLTLNEMEKSFFDQGFRPEQIMGVTNVGGVVRLLLKWEGKDEATFIRSSELGARYPDLLIDFYESNIIFED